MIPIDFQVTCLKVKIKPLYLLTPSLDQYQTLWRGCPQWVDDPYWFSGHIFKVQGQTTLLSPLFSAHCVVRSISFYSFTWSIPKLVHGLRPISRWSLLIFRSHVQRSRSNHSSQPTLFSPLCCPLNIFWPLHLINTKLGAGVALDE